MSSEEEPAQVIDEGGCTNKWTLISLFKQSAMQDFHSYKEGGNVSLQNFKGQDNSCCAA